MRAAKTSSCHAERLLHTAFGWYALTREPSDLGPFPSSEEATVALERHIRAFRGVTRQRQNSVQGMSLHDSASCSRNNCGLCAEAHIARESRIAS
ncbi:hypothetical protein [Marinobacter sp.]|uniref:hypothetical protein n=1 Tax=Marinobacter sp. TaxID=50741 RepID=UPI0034A1FCC3